MQYPDVVYVRQPVSGTTGRAFVYSRMLGKYVGTCKRSWGKVNSATFCISQNKCLYERETASFKSYQVQRSRGFKVLL